MIELMDGATFVPQNLRESFHTHTQRILEAVKSITFDKQRSQWLNKRIILYFFSTNFADFPQLWNEFDGRVLHLTRKQYQIEAIHK